MNISNKDLSEINQLIELALDGSISPEQSQRLNDLIVQDPSVCQYYCQYIYLTVGVERLSVKIPATDLQEYNAVFDKELWDQLAYEERVAPEIELPKEEPQRELIQKVVYPPREKRKVSKLHKVFLAMNAAAVLFIMLFLRFTPPKGIEVATLTDSINAKWGCVPDSMAEGERLVTGGDTLILQKGIAELLFDSNAKVVIEGPAEFGLLAEDQIELRYGRIYATVPKEAIGFSVYTENAKIVDMGTEFGVEVVSNCNTKLHVLKGKARLIAGKKDSGIGVEVGKGVAKKVSGTTQAITDISLNKSLFARAFDSEKKIIWRQQPSLDLADIAGKGNGAGTGQSSVIIHPVKGYTKDYELGFIMPRGFLPIRENPFLDGVFVPNGPGDLVVSTQRDVFKEAPKTSGLYSIDMVANPAPGFFKAGIRKGSIEFERQLYGYGAKSCITMHANIGLTFDLAAIRKSYQRNITQFTAQIGIADTNEPFPCNADFWVLVDGEVRYSLRQYKQKGVLNNVSVAIKDTDRFLTLMTTDGGDLDEPEKSYCYSRANTCDWCVFTEPVLVLE